MSEIKKTFIARGVNGRNGYSVLQVYEGGADAARRACPDCKHFYGAISWWCISDAATTFYGTNIPGRSDCPFWEAPRVAKWWERWLHDALTNVKHHA